MSHTQSRKSQSQHVIKKSADRHEDYGRQCKEAKLQAGIKPTALCSAIDKENSIESLLDLLHYIYNYYHGYAPCLPQFSYLSADFFVTCCDCDYDYM